MDQLLTSLEGLDQDQAVVLLFTGIIALVAVGGVVAVVLRAIGKGGMVALFVAAAAVAVVALLR